MNYKLTIFPALENENKFMERVFSTSKELVAAKNTAADMLLFIQDDFVGVMEPYSNMFIMEALVDGEWEEFDDGEWEEFDEKFG